MNLETKVIEWNSHYAKIGMLKDVSATEYEELVVSELLGVCDEDPALALAVFQHPQNQGGWMLGDVGACLSRMLS